MFEIGTVRGTWNMLDDVLVVNTEIISEKAYKGNLMLKKVYIGKDEPF